MAYHRFEFCVLYPRSPLGERNSFDRYAHDSQNVRVRLDGVDWLFCHEKAVERKRRTDGRKRRTRMKITWYGTASILIETKKTALLFDPYMKDLPQKRESQEVKDIRKRVFQEQKNVLITHGHLDHLASIQPLYNDLPCTIYLTKTPYQTLKKRKFPIEKLQEIHAGEEIRFEDVTVRALRGKHVTFVRREVAKFIFGWGRWRYLPRAIRLGIAYFRYPENGEILMYEIESEGKRIQLMGSAGLHEDVDYATGADVLILPHQGRSDIDEYNAKIVEKLQPKRILLDHYDDAFPPFSADIPVDTFCERISKTIPTEKLLEGMPIEI